MITSGETGNPRNQTAAELLAQGNDASSHPCPSPSSVNATVPLGANVAAAGSAATTAALVEGPLISAMVRASYHELHYRHHLHPAGRFSTGTRRSVCKTSAGGVYPGPVLRERVALNVGISTYPLRAITVPVQGQGVEPGQVGAEQGEVAGLDNHAAQVRHCGLIPVQGIVLPANITAFGAARKARMAMSWSIWSFVSQVMSIGTLNSTSSRSKAPRC